MLKIIMGSEFAKQYVKGKYYVKDTKTYFNEYKKKNWFKPKIVKDIIRDIDKAEMDGVYSVISLIEDTGYSVNDLAGGTKTLIAIYNERDTVFYTSIGDNCTDFLERIALDYEKQGEDLVIVSNYLNDFQFNYVDSIEYLNWGIICHSFEDINRKVWPLWYEQEHPKKTPEEIAEEEEYDEMMMLESMKNLDRILEKRKNNGKA